MQRVSNLSSPLLLSALLLSPLLLSALLLSAYLLHSAPLRFSSLLCSSLLLLSALLLSASPLCSAPLRPDELWVRGEHSLLEARLFPALHPREGAISVEVGVGWLLGGAECLQRWREAWRLSLKEVLSLTHLEPELQWREELLLLAGRRRVFDALMSRTDVCLLPCFRAAVLGGQQGALLETLDSESTNT